MNTNITPPPEVAPEFKASDALRHTLQGDKAYKANMRQSLRCMRVSLDKMSAAAKLAGHDTLLALLATAAWDIDQALDVLSVL